MKKSLLCLLTLGTVASASAYAGVNEAWGSEPGPQAVSTTQLPDGQSKVVVALANDISVAHKPSQGSNPFFKSTRSDEEGVMTFSYAGEPEDALKFNSLPTGTVLYQAIYLPESFVQAYAGTRVTALTFCSGQDAKMSKASVFVAANLSDMPLSPLYSEDFTGIPTTNWSLNTLTFSEAYTISADQPFYIGFSATPASAGYYIPVDMNPEGASQDTNLIGTKAKTSNQISWQTAYSYGSLCIYLTIEGVLPENGAKATKIVLPASVAPDAEFSADVIVKNMFPNDINSFAYEYQIGEDAVVNGSLELPEGLAYGETYTLSLNGLTYANGGNEVSFKFDVTEVNGVANKYADSSAVSSFMCFNPENGYASHALIEEGTGTWCGYCPIGITMMEMAKEINPDFYHCAALHYANGPSAPDPMEAPSTYDMLDYFSGFPSAMINRTGVEHPGNLIPYLEPIYDLLSNQLAYFGFNGIEVSTEDGANADITVSLGSAVNLTNNDRFRVGLYITEDQVGPYTQTNYYAGNPGQYYGWGDKGSRVSLKFDDVVRLQIGGIYGVSGSMPDELAAGEAYTYSTTASLSAVKGEEYNVIAYIVDNATGEIVNSFMVAADKTTGVEAVEAVKAVKVIGLQGAVALSGEYKNADVFDLAGRKVAAANGADIITLPAGVYVVNVDGKTSKVFVR